MEESENEVELSCELKDILEMIHRYNASHKEGCFIYSFMGFKKEIGTCCDDCGGELDEVDDNKTLMGVYGDQGTVRILNNTLRDIIDNEADEEGFVNF